MPKIRDLGINRIPTTMRPLEVGAGGAPGPSPFPPPCPGASGPPKPPPGPGCEQSRKPGGCGEKYLGADAVAQLRQQLDQAIRFM
jgi:hypothetical protein